MDPATLAATVVGNFLLPYVKMGADSLAEHISQEAGQTASDFAKGLAQSLWSRVEGLFHTPVEQGTLEQFQKQPEKIQPLVESMLEDKLKADHQLMSELDNLVNATAPGGTSAQTLIQGAYIAGVVNAQGASISGNAHVGGVQIGSFDPLRPPQPPAPDSRPAAR